MKAILNNPAVYQLYQEMGGFFGARVVAIREYLAIKPGARVIDIGCGPGHIVKHLPRGIDYTGFDIDPVGIAYAERHFGGSGRFLARSFDAAAARELAGADVVTMNGVIHHMSDEDLAGTLQAVHDVLADDGVLFTLDGCYVPGQSRIAKWLLDNDRGTYVRNAEGYKRILEARFSRVKVHLRDDLSRIPYTFAIGVAHKRG
jgi:SAM-dependent methyltransferase